MSNLIPLLRTTLTGAETQELPDSEIRSILLGLLLDCDRPMSTIEAAQWLKKSPITLKRWRTQGRGPTYRRLKSGRIEYTPKWLLEYSNKGIVK